MNGVRVIVYSEDEMKSYGGYLAEWKVDGRRELDAILLEDCCRKIVKLPPTTAQAIVCLREEIIELDPTTMKRIGRYNLEKENEELLYQIKSNERKIESLKKEYEELQGRLERIKEIGADIWKNGTEYENEQDYDEY